jgi:hypothetical protein
VATTEAVREYWNRHIHDLEITRHPVGSRGFFDDLDQYHFEKLHHLLRLVAFDGYRGRSVLEVGCGAGVDLARFAKGGAEVTGVDLSAAAIIGSPEQQGLEGGSTSPTASAYRFKTTRLTWFLPTGLSSTPQILNNWWNSATACSSRAVRRCFRFTTESPG